MHQDRAAARLKANPVTFSSGSGQQSPPFMVAYSGNGTRHHLAYAARRAHVGRAPGESQALDGGRWVETEIRLPARTGVAGHTEVVGVGQVGELAEPDGLECPRVLGLRPAPRACIKTAPPRGSKHPAYHR
jgi:hypothetical protein